MTIQIKLFIGVVQNKELKMHLDQSAQWKEAKLVGQTDLKETNWQEKEYIGYFIPQMLNCRQIKEKEQEIKTQLQLYCPKLNLDRYSAYLISQFFIL
jgi:hypothetical protein